MLVYVVLVLATCIYAYYKYKFSFFSKRGIPGPKPVMFVGNMLDKFEKPWMTGALRHQQTYGKVYGIFYGSTPTLVVGDPVILKKMMVQDFAHFTDRITTRFEHPIEQKMMIVLDGDEWAAWRKIMTPAFSPQKLKAMMPLVQSSVDHLVTEIKRRVKAGGNINVKSVCTDFSLEVIAKTGLGIQMNLHEEKEPIVEAIKSYFRPSSWSLALGHILPKWFKTAIRYTAFNKEGLKAACDYTKIVMQERRKNLDQKRNFADFTSLLLSASKDGRPIPDDEIIANIMLLFLAGFDSIALLLSLVIYTLAQYPEIQGRLHDEVISVCKGEYKQIDFDAVKDMKYMEAVLNETLRLYPPATYTERKVSKAYDMNGIHLPVGLNVFIPTYLLHYDEKHHPNARMFDPERFMPERIGDMDPFTFLPFGHGPRACPGLRFTIVETKIALSRLLLEFQFIKCDDGPELLDVSETVDELLSPAKFFVQFLRRTEEAID